MSKLVIVESPAKAKTIGKYLGADYSVMASMGHVRDLPKSKIGIDIDNGFKPDYNIMSDKRELLKELRAAAEKSEFVDAPVIRELPMAVECRLKSYNPETCIMIGEVINVCADESVLTNGKIDPKKLRPITFDGVNHTYVELGEVVGKAFSDGLTIG